MRILPVARYGPVPILDRFEFELGFPFQDLGSIVQSSLEGLFSLRILLAKVGDSDANAYRSHVGGENRGRETGRGARKKSGNQQKMVTEKLHGDVHDCSPDSCRQTSFVSNGAFYNIKRESLANQFLPHSGPFLEIFLFYSLDGRDIMSLHFECFDATFRLG